MTRRAAALPVLSLAAGREQSLARRHPWIYSGAVAAAPPAGPGETVLVRAADGREFGVAAYSPRSRIVARVWDWSVRPIDAGFFEARLRDALALREALVGPDTDALRLVHAEADGLPGVIIDRYAALLVVQLLSAGAERWRETIAAAAARLTGCAAVYERSEDEVRVLEGLERRSGALLGSPPAIVTISESGLAWTVDPGAGQKTGFFLDQRDNRRLVRSLAGGRSVLDCFSYSGGFTLSALAGGASAVLAIDSSPGALERLAANLALNGLDARRCEARRADVFEELRRLRDRGARYDLIVLDPPKFAPTAASVARAARAYKDINLLAFRLLAPGGLLATFSCSGAIDAALFQKIVAGAALDAGVEAAIVRRLGPGADHPVALAAPETDYLKGLLCRRA
jgi:23S rRNA (cytosine1962-C5)-methyltransferase